MFFLLVLVAILVSIVVRILTLPFRYRRSYYGYDNPYRYGCLRHHRLLGRLLPILALVALDRIFTRRY
jgi:hypothetical protein